MAHSIFMRAGRIARFGLGLAAAAAVLTIMPAQLPDDANAFFQEKSVTYSGLQGTKTLAITLDDGPSPATRHVLDILQANGIKGTFFIVGKRVDDHPDLMRRMRDEGHMIANHSFSHPALGRTYARNPEMLIKQIGNTHNAIAPYARVDQEMYFRAPYGVWRRVHAETLNSHPELRNYVGPIFWDVGGQTHFDADGDVAASADWDCWRRDWSAEECAKGYMREIRRKKGGVVLMHDVRMRSAQMLSIMVPVLLQEGYRFVTLDQVPAYAPLKTPKPTNTPVSMLRGSYAVASR